MIAILVVGFVGFSVFLLNFSGLCTGCSLSCPILTSLEPAIEVHNIKVRLGKVPLSYMRKQLVLCLNQIVDMCRMYGL